MTGPCAGYPGPRLGAGVGQEVADRYQAGMLVDNIEVRQPSLDDVFFALTGAHIPGDNNGAGAAERESEGAQA